MVKVLLSYCGGTRLFLSNWYRGCFPAVKRSGRDVDRLTASNVEIKNGWSCNCTPPVCLRGVERDSCSYLLSSLQEATLKWSAVGTDSSVGRTVKATCCVSYVTS
jgi:hypothetical protein